MAYIYRHIRLDTNIPFYIGKGSDSLNFKRAYSLVGRNKRWHNVVNKCGYKVEIILDNLSNKEALAKEIEFILLYGRIDTHNGLLVNATNGGEGDKGRTPWNKGLKTGVGGYKGLRNEDYKSNISTTLKLKGIKPIPYDRTPDHLKNLSINGLKNSIFVSNNPNSSGKWTSFVESKNGMECIHGFKDFCKKRNIHYINLIIWSRKNKKGLHPKYNMRIILTVKDKMIEAATLKLGYTGKNDNEADALWIYQFVKQELGL